MKHTKTEILALARQGAAYQWFNPTTGKWTDGLAQFAIGLHQRGFDLRITPPFNPLTRNTKNPLYCTWSGMKARCYNTKSRSYHRYGGRGISVCEEWRKSFEAFVSDMFPTWKPGLQIDRIDNNGNYYPENCRWVTNTQNQNNKQNSPPNPEKLESTSSPRFIVENEIAHQRENSAI